MGLPQLSSISHAFRESDIDLSDLQQLVAAQSLIKGKKSPLDKALGFFSVGSSAIKLGKAIVRMKDTYEDHVNKVVLYTLAIKYDDFVTNVINDAVMELTTKYSSEVAEPTTLFDASNGKMVPAMPDRSVLRYKGQTIYITPTTGQTRREVEAQTGFSIRCANLEVLEEFFKELDKLYDDIWEARTASSEARPDIYKWVSGTREAKYDGFLRENKDRTLFLKEGQKEALYKVLDDFDESAQQYYDLGVPYKMGICLYGPPGTGKTSTIKAIATHMARDIYYISLETLEDDEMLSQAISEGSDKVIVFEDIDIVSAAHEGSTDSTNTRKGITRQGLLNVLDGINSPNDAIFVMTTNNREVLDSALTRSGRVDYEMELDFLDQYQLNSILEFLKVEQRIVLPEGVQVTGSDIMGVARQFIKNTSEAGPEIQKFISGKEMQTNEVTKLGDTI